MKIGTKSLLFGVHQVFIHPIWVALAWWKLYGFPWDYRLWVAFIVHDWGYWGSPEMDGEIGDAHPKLGAKILHRLFDRYHLEERSSYEDDWHEWVKRKDWYYFGLYHSRFLAKQHDAKPSKLCIADKYAVALEPWWLYLPRARLSGELDEYMKSAEPDGKHGHMNLKQVSAKEWYLSVQQYLRKYVEEHKDGKDDIVTQVK